MRKPVKGAGLPKDVYPVLRVSTEYHLRGFELLNHLQGDILQALIFTTILHGQLTAPDVQAPSVRGLARVLAVPYETVRRHAVELVRTGQCVEKSGGLIVPPRVQNGGRVASFLLGIHANAIQVLTDLTAIKVASYRGRAPRTPAKGKLTGRPLLIALAGTAMLLAGLKTARTFWEGDIVTGLVYTAIWMANVKHNANSAPYATRDVLSDELRQPVSALAVSKTLGLPYETTRRHVQALIDGNVVVRVGRNGLIVPAKAHRGLSSGAVLAYELTMDFLADLRRGGVKV
jgi:predicted ArsR family transcriptional regulator